MKNAITLHNADGITITVNREAEDLKRGLIANASTITKVDDDFCAEIAAELGTGIKRLLNQMEASRKDVKGPILEVGRKIDGVAKTFAAELETQQRRLAGLLGEYNRKQEAERQKAIAEARRKAEEEAAKVRAEIEAQKAQEPDDVAASIESAAKAEQAAKARADAEAEARALEKQKTVQGSGVSFREVVTFEVVDMESIVHARPDLLVIQLKRSEIIKELKEGKDIPGIRKIIEQQTVIKGGRA